MEKEKKMNLYDGIRLLGISMLVTGCAVGNQYDYRSANLPMSVEGKAKLGVSVEESRPYVVDGSKAADFVGLQRGGFGNPFNVTTESGKPLADDMKHTLVKSLSARGFNVVSLDVGNGDLKSIAGAAEKNGLMRVAILDVKEWKSDAMMKLTMHHNLVLSIYDETGGLLAEARSARTSAIGSARLESDNAAAVRGEFERVVGGLFEDGAVKAALQ
jgi:hypothetical protein